MLLSILSLQAPTSPQVQSGAQSSTSMPTDLDQKESDLNFQLDKLSAEALRLEVTPNPSIRDRSRMRTIEGVTDQIVKQLEEIAQQRMRLASSSVPSQSSKVHTAKPIAATLASKSEAPSAVMKAIPPPTQQPLTIEKLLRGMSGQPDPGRGTESPLPLVSLEVGVPQPATPPVKASEPIPARSRERTPVRRSRSATPTGEGQQPLPAIEDGTPPTREVEQERPQERERTPRKESTKEKKKKRRSPSTSRDRSPRERQRTPTTSRERSRHGRRHSPSPVRDRHSEEHRHSSVSTREHRHDRRRRSPTSRHDRVSEERRRSPSPSKESRRERRRRRHSSERSEVSRDERRRSPSPKMAPESPKVSSKKSKKSGKKEKKASKSSRRTEAVEIAEDKPIRDERSRSVRRPEPSRVQPLQSVSLEDTETDDHPPKDDRPAATHDRPVRPRPRFDPSREHASAQRVMERRKVQPPREHGRDPGTDGPPDNEAEAKQRKKYPPPPPPASSMRQTQTSNRSLAFAKPPPRRDSATESSRVSERPLLRIRSQETPPQRPMPKRVVATSTLGSSAPPRLQNIAGSAPQADYYDQSRVRDDRTYGVQPQQQRQDWGSSQRRVPSMGRRESLHAWAEHQHSGRQYQDWGQQQPTSQEYWHDPQQGYSQHYPQQSVATQQWHAQQQQQMQQQLPALPNPVYPPGMQPHVQPPPGLGSNVQRTRQGVMTQGATMQYGSAVSRQQSPVWLPATTR